MSHTNAGPAPLVEPSIPGPECLGPELVLAASLWTLLALYWWLALPKQKKKKTKPPPPLT